MDKGAKKDFKRISLWDVRNDAVLSVTETNVNCMLIITREKLLFTEG